MKTRGKKVIISLLAGVFLFAGCETDDENKTLISRFNSDNSHKTGENCMVCHKAGASGKGWFTIAGSVYKSDRETPYAGSVINFYSEPNGAGLLRYTLEVDKKGNFYTTEPLNFQGLYVSAKGGDNQVFMAQPVANGACNSCHNNRSVRIWANQPPGAK